jgi:hypothetical protein
MRQVCDEVGPAGLKIRLGKLSSICDGLRSESARLTAVGNWQAMIAASTGPNPFTIRQALFLHHFSAQSTF